MTSISATSTSSYSPLDRLKSELTKEVSAGTFSSSDETALSSALDDIDSALKSGASSSSSSSPPSPDEMQSKIDDVIQSEVSSGKLTSDQASELKNVFANTFSGISGAGGPPPPPNDSSDSSSTGSTDSTSSSSSSSASAEDLMKELIAMLQSATSQSTSYGSSGNSNASSASALLVDYKT
ncbi:hypothetical protein RAD16_07285 [Bradyrhizobium sp. 18BD]